MLPTTVKRAWNISVETLQEMQMEPPQYSFNIEKISTKGFCQNEAVIKKYGAKMQIREIVSPEGFHIMRAHLSSEEDGFFNLAVEKPYVHLFFTLNNNRSYYTAEKLLGELKPGEHQIFLFEQETITAVWDACSKQEFFEISMTYNFFNALLPETVLDNALTNYEPAKKESTTLFARPLPITPSMEKILQDILHQDVATSFQPLYIKAKIMELIALQFSQYESNLKATNTLGSPHLQQKEIERMLDAKQMIEKRLNNPPTLHELALSLGTNECYLKKHFKQVFGTTVYNHINQTRMDRAITLLRDTEKPIAEIARFLGYSHVSHFSSRFKKHYGFSPKQLHKISGD